MKQKNISTLIKHDTNLAALSALLNYSWPVQEFPYAGVLVVELRQEANTSNYFVQLLFKNNNFKEVFSGLNVVQMDGN